MSAAVFLYQDGELVSMTPQPPALLSRVDLGPVSQHARLILEIESSGSPVERELARRLDVVRTMLLDGDFTAREIAPPLIRLLRRLSADAP